MSNFGSKVTVSRWARSVERRLRAQRLLTAAKLVPMRGQKSGRGQRVKIEGDGHGAFPR